MRHDRYTDMTVTAPKTPDGQLSAQHSALGWNETDSSAKPPELDHFQHRGKAWPTFLQAYWVTSSNRSHYMMYPLLSLKQACIAILNQP